MNIEKGLNCEDTTVIGKGRPEKKSRESRYLLRAAQNAEFSTCLRRQYGAVIVINDETIAEGYNGACRGEKSCDERGICYRIKNNIPSGERYEMCVSVHAEMNAMLSASRRDMIGGTLYLFGAENGTVIQDPKMCSICERLFINSGLAEIVTLNGTSTRDEIMNKREKDYEKIFSSN